MSQSHSSNFLHVGFYQDDLLKFKSGVKMAEKGDWTCRVWWCQNGILRPVVCNWSVTADLLGFPPQNHIKGLKWTVWKREKIHWVKNAEENSQTETEATISTDSSKVAWAQFLLRHSVDRFRIWLNPDNMASIDSSRWWCNVLSCFSEFTVPQCYAQSPDLSLIQDLWDMVELDIVCATVICI